jgi:predicted HAD superfamily Cof-like phosphohydrolase
MRIFALKSEKMKLSEVIAAVEKFHDSFGIKNNYEPTTALSAEEIQLRYKLMREENEEYLEAANNQDIVEIADALGDQLYILCGTILKHGLQDKIAAVFEEIQRSNMSKLDKDGKAIYREDGKILKSDLYFKPNIKKILEA